jgi:precorrin-2 methylase
MKLYPTNSYRFFQQTSALDEQTVQHVWRAFGSYIAKELRNGRGVAVPRFGNFTFTSTIVDLGVRIVSLILIGHH